MQCCCELGRLTSESGKVVHRLRRWVGVSLCSTASAQAELISGDQNGNIRVWDLTANACSRELYVNVVFATNRCVWLTSARTATSVPAGQCAIRSLAVARDATRVVAANNAGAVFVWRVRFPFLVFCFVASPS